MNEDYISGRLVKRAIRKIYNAGGCGGEDEYSRGYDDAVTVVLNILLEETGYVLEDALDDEADTEDQTV